MAYTTIDDPSAYFQATTYTGAGASQTVTNDGNSDLQPDFLWIKRRNAGYAHALFDSNRGLGSSNPPMLESDSTAAENSNQNWISGVSTDGFTIGINEQNLSNASGTYVAWQWKANGGTTASNSDGSITSTVQANQDAGFSIVTYTGTGSANTVGHGLADTPDVIIFKNRDDTNVWATYHQGIGNNEKLVLNTNAAEDEDGSFMNGTLPTSSVFSVGASVNTNGSGDNYVAYCFAEKQGYSKFSSYVGNGTANNGPFVYLGFKPRFIMIKSTTATGSHVIWDSKRSPFNGMDDYLVAAEADAEGTNGIFTIDAVSNGFKIMNTGTNNGLNQSSTKYVYYAFAENPFTTSTGIPATAR
jgi:hypothetical protein